MDLNELDADLLNAVQWSFPLTATPFADLAAKLDRSEDDVIGALRAAKDAGVLRQLSAIFDTRALGYECAENAPSKRAAAHVVLRKRS